jgi:hypothetical protein
MTMVVAFAIIDDLSDCKYAIMIRDGSIVVTQ